MKWQEKVETFPDYDPLYLKYDIDQIQLALDQCLGIKKMHPLMAAYAGDNDDQIEELEHALEERRKMAENG
jgi:hypothetical protein